MPDFEIKHVRNGSPVSDLYVPGDGIFLCVSGWTVPVALVWDDGTGGNPKSSARHVASMLKKAYAAGSSSRAMRVREALGLGLDRVAEEIDLLEIGDENPLPAPMVRIEHDRDGERCSEDEAYAPGDSVVIITENRHVHLTWHKVEGMTPFMAGEEIGALIAAFRRHGDVARARLIRGALDFD